MAAFDRGPGKGATGAWEIELLRKRLVRAAEVTDPRRCERAISLGEVVLVLSEDMAEEGRCGRMGRDSGLYQSWIKVRTADSISSRDVENT